MRIDRALRVTGCIRLNEISGNPAGSGTGSPFTARGDPAHAEPADAVARSLTPNLAGRRGGA